MIGGPIGDRIGTRRVIWWSILGVLPFTLALPYVGLLGTAILSVIIGLILASAHPAIIVYAQTLIPGRVGMVAGLFFGLAFGVAGIGAAFLGWLADATSITFVYHVCAFLPAIGLLAVFLPEMAKPRSRRQTKEVSGTAARRSHPPSDAQSTAADFFFSQRSLASSSRTAARMAQGSEHQAVRTVYARRFCAQRLKRQRPSLVVKMRP